MPPRRRPRGAAHPDPYESAVDRFEQTRQAEHEFGEAPPSDPSQDLTAPFRRQVRVIFIVCALFLVFGLIRSAGDNQQPKLAADCARSRLALSSSTVEQGGLVRWTATGPSDATVVLAVDVAGVAKAADGSLRREPSSGRLLSDTQLASDELPLKGCRASGAFGAVVPAGKHTVSLFRLGDTGGEPVASASLQVTANR